MHINIFDCLNPEGKCDDHRLVIAQRLDTVLCPVMCIFIENFILIMKKLWTKRKVILYN